MANDFSVIMDKILANALIVMREQAILPKYVTSEFGQDPARRGDAITFPIYPTFGTAAVSPSNTLVSPTDKTVTSKTLTLNNWRRTDAFSLTDKQMTEIDARGSYLPTVVVEAARALANYVNDQIFAETKNFYSSYGYTGSVIDGIPFDDNVGLLSAAKAAELLQDEGKAPPGAWYGWLTFAANTKAVTLPGFVRVNESGSPDVIRTGQLGMFYGIEWHAIHGNPTHTTGAVGTILVDDAAAVAVGIKTIHMDGFTTKASVGDLFTIAGDTQSYVVTAASDLAGTDSDVSFEPGLKVALPDGDNNEAVTFLASHKINPVWHPSAIGFATAPIALDMSGMPGSEYSRVFVDDVSGLSLRLNVERQHAQNVWWFDILFGVATLRPGMGVRLLQTT